MTRSTLLPALGLATVCFAWPYLASLLAQVSLAQRIVASLCLYVVVSARLQQRSAKRFQVSPSSKSSIADRAIIAPISSSRSVTTAAPTRKLSQAPAGNAESAHGSSIAQKVATIRSEQCPQLLDACYLDAAAAPPFPTGLVEAVADNLSTKLLSNPHSKSPSAISTADQIASIRLRVMRELFGIEDTHNWHLVFTSGTTASLKLVGESFDWSTVPQGQVGFKYLLESHTSAVGIRDLASRAGVASRTFLAIDSVEELAKEGLVVLPLQCNATGRRYTDLVKQICRAKSDKAIVMVDAASYLSSSSRLDFPKWDETDTPDMVAFSFYKIFGYPTGLGGLLVKASAAPQLSNKSYFGGGTVDSILAESRWTKPRKDFEARFEDGTSNIHGILAVGTALDHYQHAFGSWDTRGCYVRELRSNLVTALQGLRHGNGSPVVRLYPSTRGIKDGKLEFGPIVNFNIRTPSGSIVPPQEVDRLASISNIHLRMGRHCNPGFVTSQLGIPAAQLKKEYAEGVGCDDAGSGASDLASASLRASLCLLNTEEDVERLVGFVARFFLSAAPTSSLSLLAQKGSQDGAKRKELKFRLANIAVYPIKSCAGQNLAPGEEWELTRHGLDYDREWIIMNLANGKALSQKRFPKMALVRPRIDLLSRTLTVAIAGTTHTITIELNNDSQYASSSDGKTATQVCGTEVRPRAHKSETLRQMLTSLLGVSCTLARQATDVSRHSKLDSGSEKVPLIFSNESPFLMINSASVAQVSEWVRQDSSTAATSSFASGSEVGSSDGNADLASDSGYSSTSHHSPSLLHKGTPTSSLLDSAASFRANFLISPLSSALKAGENENEGEAWSEDSLQRIVLGGKHVFGVLGECRRCQMVCVDQKTGEAKPQTLKTLAKYRRNERGRIIFGSHLAWLPDLTAGGDASEGSGEGTAKVWVGMEVDAS